MKKFLLMMTIFICMGSTVFGADRKYYNTSWDDDYLGTENIKQVFDKMGYTGYTDEILGYTYNNFITNYAKLKELYPSANLRNLVFWANDSNPINQPQKINVSISNGTFGNDDIPYLTLVEGSRYVDYTNWTHELNSTGSRVQSFYMGGNVGTIHSHVYLSQITIDNTSVDYKITGKMFSFFDTYTVFYRQNTAFLSDSLTGLLIAPR